MNKLYKSAKNFVVLMFIALLCESNGLCCGALLQTPQSHIDVASESAVIVWDENTQTESFIRGAEFRTSDTNIGFLVPTPEPPTLTEAKAWAFSELEWAITPDVITRDIPIPLPMPALMALRFLGGTAGNKLATSAGSVSVISETRIGDYDAAVLQASDTDALSYWLRTHGYVSRPAVQDWLKTYVDKRWTITAFKVAERGATGDSLTLSPICMTFHADHPFYPYSEPADMREGGGSPDRLLRVFVFSDHRVDGSLDGVDTQWPGETVYANKWTPADNRGYRFPYFENQDLGIPSYMTPARGWMTVFEDRSSPRPGIADISFTPSNAGPVLPPPTIKYQAAILPVPLEPLLLIGYVICRIRPDWYRTARTVLESLFQTFLAYIEFGTNSVRQRFRQLRP